MPAENYTPQNACLDICHPEREEACGETINARQKYTATVLSLLSPSLAPYLRWAKAHMPVLIQSLDPSPESRVYNCPLKKLERRHLIPFKSHSQRRCLWWHCHCLCCYPSLVEELAHERGKADSKGWKDLNPVPHEQMAQLGSWANSSRLDCRSKTGDMGTANWGCSTDFKGTRFLCFPITDNINSFFFTNSE